MAEAAYPDEPRLLPVGSLGRNSVGWWGVLCLIATESCLFAYLLFSYAYMAVQYGRAWLPEAHPSISLSGPDTLILLASSVAAWWGEEGVKHSRRPQHLAGVGLAILLGLIFLVVQVFEWKDKGYTLSTNSYSSLYFTITGFHMAHVVVGVLMLGMVLIWSLMGYFSPRHHVRVSVASLYWHFVDAVWLCVFFTFYISPYLMG
ncbi:MAG: heme-copper oxidase subunit III [Caulobacteraceae bacterium]|nr:heme-copper oxidase subunit III [Caulobacteraceae bacterium]